MLRKCICAVVCCNDVSVEQRNMSEWGCLGLSMNRGFYTPYFMDTSRIIFTSPIAPKFEKKKLLKKKKTFHLGVLGYHPLHIILHHLPPPPCQLKQLHQHCQDAFADNLLLLIHSITFMTTQSTHAPLSKCLDLGKNFRQCVS